MIRKLLILCALSSPILAQTTTIYTGTIKDLSGNAVTSGKVTFTLAPSTDSTIPGIGRFVPTTIACTINADGTLSAQPSGACTVASNTSISPTGTAYKICIQPYFAQPGSCFFDYAVVSTKDISTAAPTLSTGPLNYGGLPGPPINFVGVWSSAITYPNGAMVVSGNNTYISLQPGNLNNTPASSPTFWSLTQTTPAIVPTPSGVQTVTQPIVGGMQTTLQANSINGQFNEELFTGSTVADRVNAAVAACGTQAGCYVIIPTNETATTVGWATPPSNVSVEDQRFFGGNGFALNGNPDFHFYHQYLVNAKGLQAWETLPGTLNSGPWGVDIEAVSDGTAPQPTAHDGVHGNVGGLIIFAQRQTGSNRAMWGQNINVQYANFTNVMDGLEIDLNNNASADDPGDGTAGIALNLIGGTNTSSRSGVAILVGNVASQTNSGFTTGIGINAVRDIAVNIASTSSKLADIFVSLPDSSAAKTAIAVSSSTIANAQFTVMDSGDVVAQKIRGLKFLSIGAPDLTMGGAELAFNQTGAQEMDLLSVHASGPPGGFNFYSAITGGSLGTPVFSVSGSGVLAWGATGTAISDSAVVAQMGIATAGQIACIKATSPRTVGYCSGTITTGASACTCN